MSSKNIKRTEIAAYSIAPEHNVWLVPCSCGKIHKHGAGEGRHERYPRGYFLKYAGQASPELLRKEYGRGYRMEIDRAITRIKNSRRLALARSAKAVSIS